MEMSDNETSINNVTSYAYVRFSDTLEFEIVNASCIRNLQYPVNKKKLYNVQCESGGYKEAVVVFVEDTKDKLKARINDERTRICPAAQLQSASDITDVEENQKKKNNEREEKLQELLNTKLEAMAAKDSGTGKNSRESSSEKWEEVLAKLGTLHSTVNSMVNANEAFQENVIKSLANIEGNWTEMKSARETADDNEPQRFEDINKTPGQGFTRYVDGVETIHCGQGIWLPKRMYDNATYNARSTSMFVKNIAVAIFGTEELKNSSVTGSKSNRTKAEAKPALNSRKALAVRDIYEFYLRKHKRWTKEKEIKDEIEQYRLYIAQKISDLNRAAKPKKENLADSTNEEKRKKDLEESSSDDDASSSMVTTDESSDDQ